ncbi:MAG: hypothetical protein M3P49_09665 [Actinomycetota bacterium]|nr:hypothetical protein [Actinomycetota bacterium]
MQLDHERAERVTQAILCGILPREAVFAQYRLYRSQADDGFHGNKNPNYRELALGMRDLAAEVLRRTDAPEATTKQSS